MKTKMCFFQKRFYLKEAKEKKAWVILFFTDIIDKEIFAVFLQKGEKEKAIIIKNRLNGNDYVGRKYYTLLKFEVLLIIFFKSLKQKIPRI